MTEEINKYFYCAGNHFNHDGEESVCGGAAKVLCKIPFTDKGYYPCDHLRGHYDYSFSEPVRTATYQWDLITFGEAKGFQNHYPELSEHIVCACTPFGKPDKDWRPKA